MFIPMQTLPKKLCKHFQSWHRNNIGIKITTRIKTTTTNTTKKEQRSSTTRILGIDPGSRITGFGIIDVTKNKSCWVQSGCIRTPDDALPIRLKAIFQSLSDILDEYKPTEMAIEKVFMHNNPDSALKLGQARGTAICAVANYDVPVYEYTPREIKQAIVGKGSATKVQIQHMIKALLSLNETPQEDAADALAIALSHAHLNATLQQYQNAANNGEVTKKNSVQDLNNIDLKDMSIFKRSTRKRRTKI